MDRPYGGRPSGGSSGGWKSGDSSSGGGRPSGAGRPGGGYSGGGKPGGSHGGGPSGDTPEARKGDDEYTYELNVFSPPGEDSTPDKSVHENENNNLTSQTAAFSSVLVQDRDVPTRQAYGTSESNFELRTNYFDVKLVSDKPLFKYTVTIEPVSKKKSDAIINGRKRRQLYKLLFEEIPDFRELRAGIATDYVKTVITSKRLYNESLSQKDYEQVYRNEFEQSLQEKDTARSSEQSYRVTVKPAGVVPISELIRYINSQPNDPSDFTHRFDAIQALNIIVAGHPNKDETIFQSGQNKFFRYPRKQANIDFKTAYEKYDLGGCLLGVRGYYSSIRTSTSRILLNVNAQCSAFYPEMNLLDLFVMWSIPDKSDRVSRTTEELERFVNKLRVRVEHTKRVKTIIGFSPEQGNSKSISFKCNDFTPPVSLSVADYFYKKYEIRLKKAESLVVNCGTNEKPAWIPSELCSILPGQAYRGTLRDSQTTTMLEIAARGPAENARRITGNGLAVIGTNPQNQTLNAFGVSISSKMLPIHARLLAAPHVRYNNESSQKPSFADWNIRDHKFFRSVTMEKWSYIFPKDSGVPNKAIFWDQLGAAMAKCGIGWKNPEPYYGYELSLQGPGDDDKNDDAIKKVMKAAQQDGVRVLLVILKTNSAAIHARFKTWGDTINGIHTVCVLITKLEKYEKVVKNAPMYYANILHKFNLKLGGINHTLGAGDLDILADTKKRTMVVGIDVTHPAPRSMENAPSIVGMVASVDTLYGQWPGSIRLQESKQEIQKIREASPEGKEDFPQDKDNMVSNIAELMESRLSIFFKNNKQYPDNILIYRDGVSEGQYNAVLKYELRPIQELCQRLYHGKGDPPKVTIVVVGKRHHTRFYPTNERFTDTLHKDNKKALCNPLPGTVVDRGITMLYGWDFYMQAHAAIKGTAKPAHYVVVYNQMGLNTNQLEKITHNLCYVYGRCTKAVSICSPVYFAHLICERGRCYLMKDLNPRGKPLGYKYSGQKEGTLPVNQAIKNDMFYV